MLRSAGVDCITANEAGLNGSDDPDALAFAANAGRTVITHDRADFQRVHTEWMLAGRSHAGVVVVTDSWMPVSALHAAIMRLQAERDAASMVNAILFIGRTPSPE